MRKLKIERTHFVWLLLFPIALIGWESCSDNGVSAVDGSLCSSGSLCKGGLRTLTTGQWWDEIQFDTLVSTLDSVRRPPVTRRVYNEHHKHTEVLSANEINREWIYQIQSRDTLIRPGNPMGDSISVDTAYLRHNDTLVEYSVPTHFSLIDTLKYSALKLPPVGNGGQWNVMTESIDSAMRVGTPPAFNFPVRYHLGIQSDGTYGANGSCVFLGKTYVCRTVERNTDFSVSIKSDTVLVFIDTLARIGDTIATSSNRSYQVEHFSFDLSASFWSTETETKLDTNYIDSTTSRESNVKYKYLTRYYDPRRSL